MKNNDINRSEFANWLDDHVAGKSTPASRTASDSGQSDLRDAARQIHDLAGQAYRALPDPSFASSWEDFMSSGNSIAAISPTPGLPSPHLMSPTSSGREGRLVSIDRALGLLVAAALILAISAGIWRAIDGTNFGNQTPPPDQTDPAFGLISAQASPTAVVDLPTAEDCTVEPLTVDEVLWYATDPAAALTNLPKPGQTLEHLQALEPKLEEAFADATQEDMEATLASHDDIAAASETQRMWMACILAESYFQVWALESPYLVQSDVINRLPPLTSVEETRAILEDLKANGAPVDIESTAGYQLFSAIGYPGPEGIHLINPDTENSFKTDAFTMALGFDRFEVDGTYVASSNIFKYPITKTVFSFGGSSLGCDGYRFDWSHAREMWLVAWAPSCG